MAYKLKTNGKIYNIRDGFTYKEEFNEELDSATLVIDNFGGSLDITPFDNAVLYDDESKIEKLYLLVDSYNEVISNFKEPLENSDTTVDLSLFSETKALERITLPNLSTTQPIGTDYKISVWDEIERIFNHFIPKIKVLKDDNIEYVNSISIDSSVKTKFENIDCPEFQWNNPNLREVLTDLFSTLDCLPVVKNNILSYFDITKKGKKIKTSLLSNLSNSMSSADYSSDLTMYMKNSIGKNKSKQILYRMLKAPSDESTITTENALITTEKPIYSVKKLVIYAIDKDGKLHKLDETDRVLEYDEWKMLSSARLGSTEFYKRPYYTDNNGYKAIDHKVSYLYYKRGGNTIENFGTLYKTTLGTSNYFLQFIYAFTLEELGTNPHENWVNNAIDPRKVFIELEYESVSDHALHAGKYLPSKHNENRLFDNQSESYVDVENQSIFEYAKINRIGNKIKTIYGEYNNFSDIPNLSDYIDDNILFSREITFYDNVFYFKGMMTENYILKDYFTGIRSKKRSWQIADANDSLTRHEIFKYYVEASFERKTDVINEITYPYTDVGNGIICDLACLKKVKTYGGYEGHSLEYSAIQTSYEDEYYPSEKSQIVLDNSVEIQGYSLCFNFAFTDNYKSADFSYKDDDDNIIIQDFYTYTNNYGNFDKVKIYLSYMTPTDFLVEDDDGNLIHFYLPTAQEEGGTDEDKLSSKEINALYDICGSKPKINFTDYYTMRSYGAIEFTYDLFKDNREIFEGTIQFEYCSDNKDIIVTPYFIKNIRAMRTTNFMDGKFKYWYSIIDSQKYSINSRNFKAFTTETDPELFDDYISIEQIDKFTLKISPLKPEIGPLGANPIKSWAISDLDDNLILAVNNNQSIYFNLLKNRDINVYNNNIDKVSIGTIKDDIETLKANSEKNLPEIVSVKITQDRVIDLNSIESLIK